MKLNSENLYDYLADDEDARVCKDISDDACHEVPGNFFSILLAQLLTKLGDALASTKVVLPWVLTTIGAPTFINGLLVPIRESGSLIPQLLIGGFIRRFAIRKWFFVVGCIVQGLCVLGIALTALTMKGVAAGALVVGMLVLFSMARAVCSVSSKDVLGKTIPKTRRGRLGGLSASVAGGVSLAVGVFLCLGGKVGETSQGVMILMLAAGCWLVAAVVYGRVNEYSGATEGDANAFKEAIASMALLKEDAPFRRFVIARCLLMSSSLAAPYIVVMAQASQKAQENTQWLSLGVFIVVSGIASIISGWFWGKMADKSSRTLMLITALLTVIVCCMAAIVDLLATAPLWFSVGLFFALSVVHQGVRLARKTYVVDLAGGNKRTDYVAVSNTLIGIALLVVGLFTAAISQFSLSAMFAVFTLASLGAAWVIRRLPEAQ